MSETKFNKLFEYGICFDVGGISQTLMQNRCGELTEEHIDYIETATIMHEQLLSTLEKFKDFAEWEGWRHALINEANELLAKARGEI